jgi:phenylpropionate dioxygenase-like ring-hydroxylating dioxygenase large terminal subunit
LTSVRTDTWGGWIFFNLNESADSLEDYLGVIPEHLDPYHPERMALYEWKTFEWPCNWKAACDAFSESYHFRALHPGMSTWANEVADIEILGIHSRMVNEYATTSPGLREETEISPGMVSYMLTAGMDPEAYKGKPFEVRLEMQRHLRAAEGASPVPIEDLTDEQLSDVYHYTIFPNVSFNLFAAGINGFRYRPHETDPQKMYYDLLLLAHFPDGEAPERPVHTTFDIGATPSYREALDTPVSDEVIEVLEQDAENMIPVQKGLASDGFRGMVVGDQEVRVRHFHQTVDEFLTKSET